MATVFGVAPPPAEMARHRGVFGPLRYPRFFYGPGVHYAWNTHPLTRRAAGDIPVVSFKTWYEQDFVAMLEHTPGNVTEWWACYFHEPEDDITAGRLTANQMNTVYARMRALRDKHPNGKRCKILVILNWWQLTQAHFDWQRLAPAIGHGDAIGVDSYSLRAASAKNMYTTPAALFAPALHISKTTGLPWAAPEFAVAMAADHDKARHAKQVQSHIDYARRHGARWVSWWCHTGGNYAPHLCSDPAYSDARAVWRNAMT